MFRGSHEPTRNTMEEYISIWPRPAAIQYSDCIYNPDPKQKGCERPARRRRFLQRFVSLDNGRVTMQRRFVGELPITSQNWHWSEGKLTFFFSPGAVLLCHKVSRYSLASSGWTLSDRSGPGHFNVNISHSWQPRANFQSQFFSFLKSRSGPVSVYLSGSDRWQRLTNLNGHGAGIGKINLVLAPLVWVSCIDISCLLASQTQILLEIEAGAENKVKHINIY